MSNRDTFNGVITQYAKVQLSVDSAHSTLASELLSLAGKCDDAQDFIVKVKHAEAYILSKDAGEYQMEAAPRNWIQTVSDIKGGMKRGLKPSSYPTYSKFKAAKVAASKASKEAANVDVRDKDSRNGDTEDTVTGVPVSNDDKVSPMIPDDLMQIVNYLQPLPELSRSKVLKEMTKIAKRASDNHRNNQHKGRTDRSKIAVTV